MFCSSSFYQYHENSIAELSYKFILNYMRIEPEHEMLLDSDTEIT